MAPSSVTRCCRARAALGRNAQERPVTQAARPQTRPAAAQTVAVAAGDTLESLARQPDRATHAPGRTSHRPQRARAELILSLDPNLRSVIGRNARGLNLREQIERIRAQAPAAPATPMRPSKPALPERARPQDWAPTVENARRLGLPQVMRPEARPGSQRLLALLHAR